MTAPRKRGHRKRVRPEVKLTLLPEAIAELRRLAGAGGSMSAVVERWLLTQR